jgi:hypothetical protein
MAAMVKSWRPKRFSTTYLQPLKYRYFGAKSTKSLEKVFDPRQDFLAKNWSSTRFGMAIGWLKKTNSGALFDVNFYEIQNDPTVSKNHNQQSRNSLDKFPIIFSL